MRTSIRRRGRRGGVSEEREERVRVARRDKEEREERTRVAKRF